MLEDSRIPSIIKEKTVPLACTGGVFWEGMLSVHRLRSDRGVFKVLEVGSSKVYEFRSFSIMKARGV